MALVTPTFSVVIATFDRGALIESTLESVARQMLDDFEVLVVSDGPPASQLVETVAQFDARFRLLVLDERAGSQYAANNFGWSEATGRYIA